MFRIPVGNLFEQVVEWLSENATIIFDVISAIIDFFVVNIQNLLFVVHPVAIIIILAALAWYLAGRGVAIFTIAGFFDDNGHGPLDPDNRNPVHDFNIGDSSFKCRGFNGYPGCQK